MRPGMVIADRFEIEALARSGGMGSVYRARDKLSGQQVAIKTALDAAHGDRFAREAVALSALRHPAIVRYVAHGSMPTGELYLAMEWLDGEDLQDRLDRGPLGIDESISLGLRVAEALAVAHARGLVHRDIKPSNIFLPKADSSAVKVLDFGVVRAIHGERATRAGVVMGTPGYMSPEQARGLPEVGPASDVFSLGCVLYECLAGAPLFVGRDVVALQLKIVLEKAPNLAEVRPDVPRSLDRLIARMLDKAPSERPEGGAALAAELAALSKASVASIEPRVTGIPGSGASGQLGSGEQRLYSVVIARLFGAMRESVAQDAATVAQDDLGGRLFALRELARTFGAEAEAIAGGSMVLPLQGSGAATDQAARAARCALGLRALFPDAAIALATGRGDSSSRLPVGEVIDRASGLLALAEVEPAPSDASDRPVFVDELSAGLLDDRFEIAAGGSARTLRGVKGFAAGARTLLGKPTPCVGRTRELGMLSAAFDECAGEAIAQAVLVEGVPGLGKSRLRQEFLARLEQRGTPKQIWVGHGDPMSSGAPFHIVSQAVRRGLGLADHEPMPLRRAKLRARLSRHFSDRELDRVTAFIGELVGVSFPDEGNVQLQAARQDGVLMGDQMRRAFENLLEAECRTQPLVLVLDDLQWGDLPTVQLIDVVLRNLADSPFLVLALARPEVHQLFPSLWSGRVVTRLQLAELPKKAATTLVRSVLDTISEARAEELVTRAAGNAFFLEELIRAEAEGHDRLPDTVLAMVQARLSALPTDARRVLRGASIYGRVFSEAGVRALLGGGAGDPRVGEWLADLVDRALVCHRDAGELGGAREYVFRHALVQQASYALLLDEDRVLGHRLAGEWLEAQGDTPATTLAEHFERAKYPERARVWYHRAAEEALEGNEYPAVLKRAALAIGCGATGDELGALHLLQAEAYRWVADYQHAEEQGVMAMQNLPHGHEGWLNAAGSVVIAASLRGNIERLVAVSEELAALGATGGDPALGQRVVAWSRATVWLLRHGRRDLAERLFTAIEQAMGELPGSDPLVMARAHYARANRAATEGDLGESLRLGQAAAQSFEEAGMLRNLCVQRKSVAIAALGLGLDREAEASVRLALVEAERLGLHDNASDARDLLGLALARQGQLDQALELCERGARECVEHGARWAEGRARTTLAGLWLRRGDLGRAEAEARHALASLSDKAPLHAVALAVLGRVARARGDLSGALDVTSQAMRQVESGSLSGDQETIVRLAHLEALRAAEDPRALKLARESVASLSARAERISDPGHRESFLSRVPENAELLALCRELGA